MTMWPLAASGGWPPARGYLHSESVNAQRMRPYMPGGRWRGGPYKRGTTVLELTTSLDTSSRTLYWNGQLVWTPVAGIMSTR